MNSSKAQNSEKRLEKKNLSLYRHAKLWTGSGVVGPEPYQLGGRASLRKMKE